APDEGHGFARPINNMAMFATTEKFLAKHLGGRYQESMTPEVAQRLKEITVDVKTVTLPKKAEPVAASAPKPIADLQAGTANYTAAIAIGGQTIPLSVKTETKEENGAWVVTETIVTPQGEITDTSTIEKGTLVLKHRVFKQGPVVFDIDFKDNKASGSVSMNGQAKPIALDLGGSIFGDGAGNFDVIAALPLAEGYVTSFRNMDLQKQKLELKNLKVVGIESVTVPAGTFEAYKVEITSADNEADKTTVWIAKDSRKVVKISAVLTQLNGAILTSELTQ
ncbi:MAG TPA: S9 family peptidase, partial [Blastocatellia bacterium]|nr:S9 family peptidase [Blastocatellia bacterium]